jgi:hypothetical protein
MTPPRSLKKKKKYIYDPSKVLYGRGSPNKFFFRKKLYEGCEAFKNFTWTRGSHSPLQPTCCCTCSRPLKKKKKKKLISALKKIYVYSQIENTQTHVLSL